MPIPLGVLAIAGAGGTGGSPTTLIAVAHAGSPYIAVYLYDANGFVSKYANPATLPTGTGQAAAFDINVANLAVAHDTSPHLSVYAWSSGFGTKYSDPASINIQNGNKRASWHPTTNNLAVAGNQTVINVWPFSSSGFGTRYSDHTALNGGARGCEFSPNGNYIAIGHQNSPRLTTFGWSNGFGTRYEASGITLDSGGGLCWSPSTNAIISANETTINAYPWNNPNYGTKYANPASAMTSYYEPTFSPDGNYAVITGNTPSVAAYNWSAGFGSKLADPATLPGTEARVPSFNSSGNKIAVSGDDSPYIYFYPWSAGWGTKYANPATLPAGTGRDMEVQPQ